MVNFGDTLKLDNVNSHFLLVVDDINSDNIEKLNDIFNKSDMYINYKFPLPPPNNSLSGNNKNNIILKINKLLLEYEQLVIQGKSHTVCNETQFKSFKAKVQFWCSDIFKDVIDKINNNENAIITIQNNISKHEWKLVKWLYSLGISFLIICENAPTLDIAKLEGAVKELSHTSENLKLFKLYDVALNNNFNNIEDVEKALYENKSIIKIIISGIDNYIDTCNFYGRLYKECQNNTEWVLINSGFNKPTYEQTLSIPRLKVDKRDYIIDTVIKFLNIKNLDIKDDIANCIKQEFKSKKYSNINSQILYNKIVYSVCVLNQLFNTHTNVKYIVYYGKVLNNDLAILDILSKIPSLSIIIVSSDKDSIANIDGMHLLELSSSTPIFDMPVIDKRDNACTLAAQAEHRVNSTLFDDNVLGLYKPGQFRSAETKHFNTTFDEIKLWWNKELYLRPGFEGIGDKAVIPTLFKVIHGVDTSTNYISMLQMYSCGKTVLCRNIDDMDKLYSVGANMHILRATDINKTKFEEQKPFYVNGKLDKQRIKRGINYKYNFLSNEKQDLVLDKIENILNSELILVKNKAEFVDTVLNVLLNIDIQVMRYIQWFEYYTYNPNLIMLLTDENQLKLDNFIFITFLKLIGFDILIFVPTCYNSIESFTGKEFIFDKHVIGEARYDIEVNRLTVTSNIEIDVTTNDKKQGLFNKIFNKRRDNNGN